MKNYHCEIIQDIICLPYLSDKIELKVQNAMEFNVNHIVFFFCGEDDEWDEQEEDW